jgi:lysyl-tRNA synthetase class 2
MTGLESDNTRIGDLFRRRAHLLQEIRTYFSSEEVTEVNTPILSAFGSCEPTLRNLTLNRSKRKYLRTSPESYLKQLLSQNIGDIYEIGPVFRDEEIGCIHLEEFTMVEWYRTNIDLLALIADVSRLLARCGYQTTIDVVTYAELFRHASGLDPHSCDNSELVSCASKRGVSLKEGDLNDRAFLLDAVYVSTVDPLLKSFKPVFIIDYPKEHRAYARLSRTDEAVALRFELIINGIEIANGYDEITESAEQKDRFNAENKLRKLRGLEQIELDTPWLAALSSGVPSVCGVALGLERLEMVLWEVEDIRKLSLNIY